MNQNQTEAAASKRERMYVGRRWHGSRCGIKVTGLTANGLVGGLIAGLMGALLAGCGTQSPLLPNSDPALRKKPADFAADAQLRHPFKTDAPSGGEARGRAAVDYGNAFVEVADLSDEDWDNAEIWINRQYVVFVPRIERNSPSGPKLKTLHFWMFFDEKGNSFPLNSSAGPNRINQLEMYRAGTMYTLKLQLAD